MEVGSEVYMDRIENNYAKIISPVANCAGYVFSSCVSGNLKYI